MRLVIWIATVVKFIEDLLAYVDDTYSWGFTDDLTWYEPYRKFLPSKQASLLLLWDEIGVPHEEDKQVFGETLTIIGMDVDPNAMTITMPQIACNDLVLALCDFSRPNQCRTLCEFQRLAGWMNWALNAYPLLCPGLSVLYEKMSGISNAHILIRVSVALRKELLWFAQHLTLSNGVHILSSNEWVASDADYSIFCDACLTGMGFWCTAPLLGFIHAVTSVETGNIFHLEA
jgi:hypothetical protein